MDDTAVGREYAGMPVGAPNMPLELTVDGGHFREGLKWFEKVKRVRATDKALVSFDRSFVLVEALDRSFVARADGDWPGTAKVGATLLVALAKAPPTTADVRIAYADGKLRVGSLSVACTWEPISGVLVNAPATPDWISTLALKYRLPRARILAEGLAEKVEEAESQLDRVIAKCAKPLAPLHVTEDDLRQLTEKRLIERASTACQDVAWAPDPPNNFGAVMAPPGPLTMREHLLLLESQVQAFVDAEDDPEDALGKV